jgi:protein-tyrosine phosphatase
MCTLITECAFAHTDTPAEDITCVLYDSLDFIHKALSSGGRILVHCSQGVSRSATLVIAYMMWRSGKPYDEVRGGAPWAYLLERIRGLAHRP